MELADIHNRRANIELVSKRAREHGYPLLAWPEDEELIRLSDIPVIEGQPNKPIAWTKFSLRRFFRVSNDADLRGQIVTGHAYTRVDNLVSEWKVTSR